MAFHYNYYCLPSTIAALVILFPLFMSVKRWHLGGRVKVLTFLLTQSLIVMLGETLVIAARTPELARFLDKIMYVGIVLYPAALFHLNLSYIKKISSRYTSLAYIPSVFFLALLPTDLFIAGMEPTYWGWGKIVGPGYFLFQVYAGIFFVFYCVFILHQFLTEPSPRLKNEILCLSLATLPSVLFGCFVLIILTPFHITTLNIMAHAIGLLWHSIALSIAMLSKRSYDVYAHLPWFSFKKKQIQKDVAELVNTGTIALSYDQIIETLNKVLRVDIAIHTPKQVYANQDCDPVFVNFSGKALFNQSRTLIRHEIASDHPEHEILARHKCDILAPLFYGDQYVGAVRFGMGLTDRLYSNYDMTLLGDLLERLRLSLFYGNAILLNPASVILHQLGGKVCSIQKTGNVCVYMVDHDNQNMITENEGDGCRFRHLPPNTPNELETSDMNLIMHSVSFCPECGSPHIYTVVQKTYLFDHQKQQIAEVIQTAGPLEQGTHGCFDCLHQWRSIPAEPALPQPSNVIDFNAYKTAKH